MALNTLDALERAGRVAFGPAVASSWAPSRAAVETTAIPRPAAAAAAAPRGERSAAQLHAMVEARPIAPQCIHSLPLQ